MTCKVDGNIEISFGSDAPQTITLRTSSTGTAIDLTGNTVTMRANTKKDGTGTSPDNWSDLTADVSANPTEGKAVFTPSSTIPVGTYFFQCWINDGTSDTASTIGTYTVISSIPVTS